MYCTPPPAMRNVIEDWRRKDLVTRQLVDMDGLLRVWRSQPQWDARDFKPLRRGLSEFRFVSCKQQLRLIGFFWPPRQPFDVAGNYTFLIGCSHKQRVYDPPDAMKTAAERMANLQRGIGSQHVYA